MTLSKQKPSFSCTAQHSAAQHSTAQHKLSQSHKRKPFVIALSIGAGIALLGMPGCQKGDALPGPAGEAAEVNVTPRVQAFVQKAMREGNFRDGEVISADSTEWYIEAALNYSYTAPARSYTDQRVDTIAISIPLTNGEVLLSQAGQAYGKLGQSIRAFNEEGKSHLALVDVVVRNNGNSLAISAVCIVGSGYERGTLNSAYGPNDYWWYMTNLSTTCGCGSNAGNNGKCADQQIQLRINTALAYPNYQYWTNVESWSVSHAASDDPSERIVGLLSHPSPLSADNPVAGDGIRDYPVFVNYTGFGCFEPVDMRFYTKGTYDLMQTVRTSYVPSKFPITCTVLGDLAMGANQRLHWVTYRYGNIAKTHL